MKTTWLTKARDEYLDGRLTIDEYEDAVALLLAMEIEDHSPLAFPPQSVSQFTSWIAGAHGRPERVDWSGGPGRPRRPQPAKAAQPQ